MPNGWRRARWSCGRPSSNDPSQFYGAQLSSSAASRTASASSRERVWKTPCPPLPLHWSPGVTALTFLYGEIGLVDDARRELDRLARARLRRSAAGRHLATHRRPAGEAIAALGDRSRAAPLYDRLLPVAGRTVVVVTGVRPVAAAIDHYHRPCSPATARRVGQPPRCIRGGRSRSTRTCTPGRGWRTRSTNTPRCCSLAARTRGARRRAARSGAAGRRDPRHAPPSLAWCARSAPGHEHAPAAEAPHIAAMPPPRTARAPPGVATFRQEGSQWTIALRGADRAAEGHQGPARPGLPSSAARP